MDTTRTRQRIAAWTIFLIIIGLIASVLLVGQHQASAAGPNNGLEVAEQNVDANGNIKVHEQGVVPVELPSRTHMGQKWQDHVVLIVAKLQSSEQCGVDDFGVRMYPDGSFDYSTPWLVPDGKVFVLTDVAVQMYEQFDTWSLGDQLIFDISSSTNLAAAVWESEVVVDDLTAAAGAAWQFSSIESGIVFRAGTAICTSTYRGLNRVADSEKLYGYLMDE